MDNGLLFEAYGAIWKNTERWKLEKGTKEIEDVASLGTVRGLGESAKETSEEGHK